MKKGYQDRCTLCDAVFYNSGLQDVCPECERELYKAKLAGGDVEPCYGDKEYAFGIYEDTEGNEEEEVPAGLLDAVVEDFSKELVEAMDIAYAQGRTH